MAVPVPQPGELALMVIGLLAVAVAALFRGRLLPVRWTVGFAGLGAFVAGIAVLFAAPTGIVAQAPLAPVPQKASYAAEEGSTPHMTIYDETVAGTSVGTAAPSYLVLPAHARVTLTIVNLDTRVSPPAAYYDQVRGTAGGVESVNGVRVARVAVNAIAHTVTVPAMNLNIPVPAARPGHAVRVVATFTTPAAGTYGWLCMCPCGMRGAGWGYPMYQAGMMRGTILVE